MSEPVGPIETLGMPWGSRHGAGVPSRVLGAVRAAAQRSGWPLLAWVAVLFAVNVAASYPGILTNDSVNQYAEAVSGRYTDWHPPVMAWLWSVLRHLAPGPAPLFVLHLAGYWAGWALLAHATRRSGRPGLAFVVALAGVFPTFLFLNASITKDVGMVAAWLPAIGLLYWFRAQHRRVPLIACVAVALLLAYGTLVRSNAIFALGPLVLYAVAPAAWLRDVRLAAAAVVIAVVALPVTQQANRVLFHPAERQAVNSLFLFDLAGIAVRERNPALLAPRADIPSDELARCYTPYWWDTLSPWGSCGGLVNRPDNDHPTVADGLVKQWASTIAAHPVAYALHRLKHFNSELMFAVPLKHIRLTPEYRTDNPAFRPLEVITPHDIRFDLVRKNPTVWPVTWLVWAGVLLAFLRQREPAPGVLLARALAVSALAYSGAYLVVGVATDIRYHYWAILAAVVATLVVLPEIAQGWRARSRTLRAGSVIMVAVVLLGLAARLLDFQAWSV